jgi:hypothetical protein
MTGKRFRIAEAGNPIAFSQQRPKSAALGLAGKMVLFVLIVLGEDP